MYGFLCTELMAVAIMLLIATCKDPNTATLAVDDNISDTSVKLSSRPYIHQRTCQSRELVCGRLRIYPGRSKVNSLELALGELQFTLCW